MREHEVPTHVQAEDKVLLWFTFPQIVALTAVCALSYGAYRYAPAGPSEVRMAIAVVLGLAGVAAVVGKIGGRRLPLVAADLLRFWLGARRYAGPPAQLVRSLPDGKAGEPPAPVQSLPDDEAGKAGGPGPLRLMARRARRVLRRRPRDNKKRRKEGERQGGRMPLRWFGKRRRRKGGECNNANAPVRKAAGNRAATRETRHRKSWLAVLAVTALAVVTLILPQSALADGHWLDEIEYQPSEPVPGRRIFVEGLEVSGDRAKVTLRAAADLHLRVRAYGGREGRSLRFPKQVGIGEPGRGGADRLLRPPLRRVAVLDVLVGGRPRPGGGRHPEGRADPIPPAIGGGGAVPPQRRVPGLDAGERRWEPWPPSAWPKPWRP